MPLFTLVKRGGVGIRVLKTYKQKTVADWLAGC
jgi:hypothetical protein